jgi:hypothetical protein
LFLHIFDTVLKWDTLKNLALVLWVCATFAAIRTATAQTTVWTYHNNNFRTGANTNEFVLTLANVNTNTFGKLFSYAVDGLVSAQPLFVPGVTVPGRGAHNAVFVATEHNTVYAFDADTAGAAGGLLWSNNLGTAAVTTIAGVFTNQDFGSRYYNAYTDIVPEVGITGTPVIDTNTGTLYVDAFTGEPGGGVTNYFHRLHALKISDGTEQPYSPVVVAASVAGNGVDNFGGRVYFNAQQQLQRSALTLAGGIVYAAYSGYADTDPFHGWVLGWRATNLLQLTNFVFNSTPNSTTNVFGDSAGEGGIWMGGSGLAVDANTNLFLITGNGSFSATNGTGGTEYGDCFLRLATAGGLSVADYFTPYNQSVMQAGDLDLGSGGVVLLPDQPVNTRVMIGAGKSATIYVLSRDQLTTGNNHFNAAGGSDAVLQTDSVRLNNHGSFGTPAYFNGCIYLAAFGDNLKSIPLTNGLLSGTTVTDAARTFSFPGATPSVSANGTNNGIVWTVRRASPALLVACDATTLTEIYTSTNAGSRDQLGAGVKFAVPTVANGQVFVGLSNSVSVFGLLATTNPSSVWRSAHFGANAGNSGIVGDTADPDGDKLPNLLEYAYAKDPLVAGTNPFTAGLASGKFQLRFPRNTFATDIAFVAQQSVGSLTNWNNLLTWTNGQGWQTNQPGFNVSESGSFGAAPDSYVNVTLQSLTNVAAAGTTKFYRLQIHR